MIRLALLISLASIVATGCLSNGDGEPLDEDTYYIGVPGSYTSAADCIARSTHPLKWDCSFALTLCHTGEAALRTGDVVTSGTYVMEGGIARATFATFIQRQLEFDVATLTERGTPIVDGVRWTHDTEGRSGTELYDTTDCR